MNLKHVTFAVAASLVVVPASANAAGIIGLVNTGKDANNDGFDDNWTVNTPSGLAYTTVNGQFPIGPWIANDSTSGWIAPNDVQPDLGRGTSPVGQYIYTLQFVLTAAEAAGAQFTGRFSVDNAVGQILLNATNLGSGSGFQTWSNFAGSTGFVAGVNTLSFVTQNTSGTSGNPAGLRVEFLTSSVPEPATWAMFLLGFGLVGFSMRRRMGSSTRIAFA